MLFKAMANRLKEINDKINDISSTIIDDLACRIFFDGFLHPIPSSTVMKYTTGASYTTVDILTEACWVNTSIQPSVTYYFSPVEPKELHPVEAVFALAITPEGINVLWTNPAWDGKGEFLGNLETAAVDVEAIDRDYIFFGLKNMGQGTEIPRNDLFVSASSELLDQLRWSRWSYIDADGAARPSFIPGRKKIEDTWKKPANPKLALWGHNYYPFEHNEEYQQYFFEIEKGIAGNPPIRLASLLRGFRDGFFSNLGPLHWIQVESDRRIPAKSLESLKLAATNCLVGLNAHYQKQNYFYHGPGPMTLELQSPANEIYEIVSLSDNHGRIYDNIYSSPDNGKDRCHYIPRIDGNSFKIIVVVPENDNAPDRFSLEYRTSMGETANNISVGYLNSIYNPQPGIESVTNLTPTMGGTSARSYNDMLKSFPRVLQSNNRAVVPSDFESLALAFDKRIKSARARPGSTRRGETLRGCVDLEIDMGGYEFNVQEEGELFLSRLSRFLEMRSPIGTVVSSKFKRDR